MIRVVANTNIYISALMFGGLPGIFLDLAFRRAFALVSSSAILDKLDEKLSGKFAVPAEDARLIRIKLEGIVDRAEADFVLRVVADDPDDDRILGVCGCGEGRFHCQRRPASSASGVV